MLSSELFFSSANLPWTPSLPFIIHTLESLVEPVDNGSVPTPSVGRLPDPLSYQFFTDEG